MSDSDSVVEGGTTISKKRARGFKVTDEQKNILISFLEEHPTLVTAANFKTGESHDSRQALWDEVTSQLNLVQLGAHKNRKEWMICWANLKSKTKSQLGEKIRNFKRTGGGELETPLNLGVSELQWRIRKLIKEDSLQGNLPRLTVSGTLPIASPVASFSYAVASEATNIEVACKLIEDDELENGIHSPAGKSILESSVSSGKLVKLKNGTTSTPTSARMRKSRTREPIDRRVPVEVKDNVLGFMKDQTEELKELRSIRDAFNQQNVFMESTMSALLSAISGNAHNTDNQNQFMNRTMTAILSAITENSRSNDRLNETILKAIARPKQD